MKIGVIGGGNIGTLIAAGAADAGHEAVVVTSSPDLWNTTIRVVDSVAARDFKANIAGVSESPLALVGCDYVFLTVPPQVFKIWSHKLKGVLTEGQTLIVVPGSGASEVFMRDLIDDGVNLYGLQRVPFISRLQSYGQAVELLGTKKALYGTAIPATEGERISEFLTDLFKTPTHTLPNYLAVTLTPSNPILHTSRLYSLFCNYQRGDVYPSIPLFYEDWDDSASDVLLGADQELQNICSQMKELDLSGVESLSTYYEGTTPSEITATIRGIKAFRGLETPHEKVSGGYIPDLSSRYFTTDFPYGLHILIQFARIVDIPTPTMDEMWAWYVQLMDESTNGRVAVPFKTEQEIVEFYG